MSLYGALYSGVSGLAAQSSAMGAISDNISNINTIGYKGTNNAFQTLVTSQTSKTQYSAGGVQHRPSAAINAQGLLSSSSSSTDMGISGDGYFVVNQSANPGNNDMWAYTRAGSFDTDENGYLKNTGGFYMQAWPLMAWDGNPNAATVKIGDVTYMKAYKDDAGNTVYVNDNIIDNKNLKPVNLNTLGGTASPTMNISFGANLPSSAEIGDNQNIAVLIYDSLGNSHNMNFLYEKESSNSWGVDLLIPDGAATVKTYTTKGEVYSARGQLEFTDVPANHSIIKVTNGTGDAAKTYVFEFSTNGTNTYIPATGEELVTVDISPASIGGIPDVLTKLQEAMSATIPCGDRFTVDDTTLNIEQSNAGSTLSFDVSKTLAVRQKSANVDPVTGIPSGTFEVPEIDWGIKNAGRIDFVSEDVNDYLNKTLTIDNKLYCFNNTGDNTVSGAVVNIDITDLISGGTVDRTKLVERLVSKLNLNATEPERFVASGISLEFSQSNNGQTMTINATNSSSLTFTNATISDYFGTTVTLAGVTYTLKNGAATAAHEVDISTATTPEQVVNLLYGTMKNEGADFEQFQINGASIISSASNMAAATGGANMTKTDYTGITNVTGQFKPYGDISPINIASGATDASPIVVKNVFYYDGNPEGESGAKAAAIRFNPDGTPQSNLIDKIGVEWANGALDQDGSSERSNLINLATGSLNTADGLTHLAGSFESNYVSQDGAKYGSYAGVTVGEDGVVTALFDNGETKAIAIVPLATFTNPNGMSSLTGNSWIATDASGAPTLRTPGEGGSGELSSYALESSTVDLATEFTNMITTQRAYSAAAKIITTADTMLDELINIKR